jgi:hypothetical protein
MQVQGDIQFLERGPEGQISSVIKIDDVVGTADLGKPVHMDTLETKLFNATIQFENGSLGILQWNSGKTEEPARPLCDRIGQVIVPAVRQLDGLFGVVFSLAGNDLQRQDRLLDSVCVHLGNAMAGQVEQIAADLGPVLKPTGIGRVPLLQGFFDPEVFFKSNLPVHPESSRVSLAADFVDSTDFDPAKPLCLLLTKQLGTHNTNARRDKYRSGGARGFYER